MISVFLSVLHMITRQKIELCIYNDNNDDNDNNYEDNML